MSEHLRAEFEKHLRDLALNPESFLRDNFAKPAGGASYELSMRKPRRGEIQWPKAS